VLRVCSELSATVLHLCAKEIARLVRIGGRTADHRRAGRPVRVLASMTALVAGLLVVAGCQGGGSSTAAPAGQANASKITVAETPGVGHAPLILAFQQRPFRRAGLDVHITNYPSARAELNALRAGGVDVAFGDYAERVLRIGRGAGQQSVGTGPSTPEGSKAMLFH
jgi:ABC-type nitrate/sulfonate/bicarbonate transport system substrate-binding protein